MANARQLNNMYTLMDQQAKQLEKKVSAVRSELSTLKNQKELIRSSQNNSPLEFGNYVNALSCWNQNQFSSLINEVLLLLEQKSAERQQELAQLEAQLANQKKKSAGLEQLSHKKELESRQRTAQLIALESEENLHRF